MTNNSENEQFHQPSKGERLEDDEADDRHLKIEELEKLLDGRLSGERLVAALIHLEDCSECRGKLPPVKSQMLLKAIFGEEEPPADDSPSDKK